MKSFQNNNLKGKTGKNQKFSCFLFLFQSFCRCFLPALILLKALLMINLQRRSMTYKIALIQTDYSKLCLGPCLRGGPMQNNFVTLGCLIKFISGLRQSITHRGGTLDNCIWQENSISFLFKGQKIDLKISITPKKLATWCSAFGPWFCIRLLGVLHSAPLVNLRVTTVGALGKGSAK